MSTVKSDPDWEGQIEIKYENIPEYIDLKEIKEELADCQGFKIKIEKCSVNEVLEDVPQEFIKDYEGINEGDFEYFHCLDNTSLDSSINSLGTKDSLENHVIVVHKRENECSAHQNIPSSNLVFPTSNKGEITLETYVNIKRKKIIHPRKKIHKCEYCDYGSPRISHLKDHINSGHTRENIHKCEYCDYKSPHISALKSHINFIHTRKKMHKCEYCDYESPQMAALKRHINSIHTKEKIRKCQYCDYGSTLLSTLKSHINSIHRRENIHKCGYCDYESSRMSNLQIHINSKHTREKIHQCQYWDYKSPWVSGLKRHIKCKLVEVRSGDI